MSDNIYRVVEVVGTSPTSIEDAARGAVSKAAKTLRQLDWFEIVGTRGHIEDGEIKHFQVTLKIGFRLEED